MDVYIFSDAILLNRRSGLIPRLETLYAPHSRDENNLTKSMKLKCIPNEKKLILETSFQSNNEPVTNNNLKSLRKQTISITSSNDNYCYCENVENTQDNTNNNDSIDSVSQSDSNSNISDSIMNHNNNNNTTISGNSSDNNNNNNNSGNDSDDNNNENKRILEMYFDYEGTPPNQYNKLKASIETLIHYHSNTKKRSGSHISFHVE
jgi:hypothetical protein